MPSDAHRTEVIERLAKIETRNQSIAKDIREIKVQLQISNGRTRSLESKQGIIFGAGSVLLVVVPVLISLLMGL